jgi:hypothetical protein
MKTKHLNSDELENISGGDYWANTYDCINSHYRDYGWSSAALWALTILSEGYGALVVGVFV